MWVGHLCISPEMKIANTNSPMALGKAVKVNKPTVPIITKTVQIRIKTLSPFGELNKAPLLPALALRKNKFAANTNSALITIQTYSIGT